jgi:argininosuccinate lyase
MALFVREQSEGARRRLCELMGTLTDLAERHADWPMPGYTHLQRAQPVTVGHHLVAWVEMLERDLERFGFAGGQAAASPLGAGALAGSTLPLPPPPGLPLRNSLDAVADRDFALDYLYACALLHSHLSRIGEEICLWATTEFGFIHLPEAAATGSSMMPQKLNPDAAELARAKAGTALGRLAGLLAVVKGLPLAYNRDLQEDKAPVFDATTHVLETLEALATAIPGLEFDEDRMAEAARDPRLLATDLAEYLVQNGVPFREAHETIAALYAANPKVDAKALRAAHPKFVEVEDLLDVRRAVERRITPGGPAPKALLAQLAKARDTVGLEQYSLSKHAESVQLIDEILEA